MSLRDKLLMPKRLMIAALIAIVTLCVGTGLQLFTTFDTVPWVRTIFIYLVLDYIWASVRREFFPGKSR